MPSAFAIIRPIEFLSRYARVKATHRVANSNEVKDENEHCNILHRRNRGQRRVASGEQVSATCRRGREGYAHASATFSHQGTIIRTPRSGDGRGYSRTLSFGGDSSFALQPRSFAQDAERHSRQDVERRELCSAGRSPRLDVGYQRADGATHGFAGGEDRKASLWSLRRPSRTNHAKDFGKADAAFGSRERVGRLPLARGFSHRTLLVARTSCVCSLGYRLGKYTHEVLFSRMRSTPLFRHHLSSGVLSFRCAII